MSDGRVTNAHRNRKVILPSIRAILEWYNANYSPREIYWDHSLPFINCNTTCKVSLNGNQCDAKLKINVTTYCTCKCTHIKF